MFGQIDFEDAIAGGLFTLASLVTTGIIAVTFLPEDISLSSAVWTVEGTKITFAFLLSLGALTAAYATNRVGQKKRSQQVQVDTDLADIVVGAATPETYIAGATLILVLVNGLNVLGAHDFIASNLWAGLSAFALQLGGYYVISHLG